jgi:hypothetical protein
MDLSRYNELGDALVNAGMIFESITQPSGKSCIKEKNYITRKEPAKKYELADETITFDGVVLHRIKALKNFNDVKEGEFGGYIQNENNLSHDGNAWVSGNAKVFGDAEVSGNAWVKDNAEVFSNAKVYGNAWVRDNTKVYDHAKVFGYAEVFSSAKVYDYANVGGYAEVFRNAKVGGYAEVYIGMIFESMTQPSGKSYIKEKKYTCEKGLHSDAVFNLALKKFGSEEKAHQFIDDNFATNEEDIDYIMPFTNAGEQLVKKTRERK